MSNERPFSRFIAELRRRRVLRVAAGYLVGGWVAIEVTSVLVPELLLPGWITRAVIVLVIAGFPAALALSWAFDLTGDGIRPTAPPAEHPDGDAAAPPPTPTPAAAPAAGPRRPWTAAPVVWILVVVLAGAGLAWAAVRAGGEDGRDVATLLPRIRALAEEGRYAEAFALAEEAERTLPDDSALDPLWPTLSDRLTVRTEPEGARVVARLLVSDSTDSVERDLGVTPLEGVRIPRAPHYLRISLDGFAPVERLASSALVRSERAVGAPDSGIQIDLEMVPADEAPPGMVYVPGGPYTLVSPDLQGGFEAALDGYFFDRFEVTNAAYREFVAAGGYARRELWPSTIVVDSDTLPFEDVRTRFADRTGLPGPRGWSSQLPPDGLDQHPVTGVSWYEATAYCAFRETSLPSIFQWEKAARDGRTSQFGVVMPWGLATATGEPDLVRANMDGRGTAPVDAHPAGIGPYGAYALAGNVKEWLDNPAAEGRTWTGGSWEDPPYIFSEVGIADPGWASGSLGFRCARVRATDARRTRDQGSFALALDEQTPTYEPLGPEALPGLLSHYRYDPRPLDAGVVDRTETSDWVRELVRYAGPQADTVLGYLWLPKSTPAPHQVILVVPAADAFFGTPLDQMVEGRLGGLIRSGRAIFAVLLKGVIGRPFPPDYVVPEPPSVGFRDLMVRHAIEIRLGIDYLEQRPDIDADRLAYAGISFGAGSRLVFAAIDDRYDAVVFIGGGIDERVKPTLPEADNVNFAPYIEAPTLLLNGRQDEEHPWLTRALPLWNLLSEPKELALVDGAGHVPPAEVLIPTIDRFLDETLGPVRR
jgi:formylglycine-generating enzyme required for sulfatase activity